MKSRVAASLLVLSAFLAGPTFAQTISNNSNSTAGSDSTSQAVVNQNSITPDDQTIRTTPAAVAPGLAAAGVHACVGSVSAGVSITGFGVSGGSTTTLIECERRAYAATLQSLGQNAAALALVCLNDEVRAALSATGVTCALPRAQPAAIPVSHKAAASNPWVQARNDNPLIVRAGADR